MDLSINLYQTPVFKSRYTKFSKEQMDKVLIPLLQDDSIELNDIILKSNFTVNAVLKWFKLSQGMTASQFFRARKDKQLQDELKNFYNNDTPIEQVANHFGYSTKWVSNQYLKMGLIPSKQEKNEKINQEMRSLLNLGTPIKVMARHLKCSVSKVRGWLNRNLEGSIVKFRHDNNIKYKISKKNISQEDLDIIKKCLKAGVTLKQIGDMFNVSSIDIYRIKVRYNIKTELDKAHEFMNQVLPDMVNANDNIKTMSRLIGLSEAAISRKIKTDYGMNYKDFRTHKTNYKKK